MRVLRAGLTVVAVTACGCGCGLQPLDAPPLLQAASFPAAGARARLLAEECLGPGDCASGLCLHMAAGSAGPPGGDWYCGRPCASSGDCAEAGMSCVEWYPGTRSCLAPLGSKPRPAAVAR